MHSSLSVFYLALIALANGHGQQADHLRHLSRSLIFPATSPTRVQFIGGIGIPVEDLHFESVTSGYVLKTEYFLPTTAFEITHVYMKPQIITDRKYHEPSKDNSNLGPIYRWIIYRALEMVLQNMKLPGRNCLLRVICEHAALPLSHESGLLGELLHIVLTPSSSMDHYTVHTDREFLVAERFGKRNGNCESAYGQDKCPTSAIDLISILI